jgi:hypothetical protein
VAEQAPRYHPRGDCPGRVVPERGQVRLF